MTRSAESPIFLCNARDPTRHRQLPFSLLCSDTRWTRGSRRCALKNSPWFPELYAPLETWHGDLARTRGETSAQSKAESRVLLASRSPRNTHAQQSFFLKNTADSKRRQTQKGRSVTVSVFFVGCAKEALHNATCHAEERRRPPFETATTEPVLSMSKGLRPPQDDTAARLKSIFHWVIQSFPKSPGCVETNGALDP